MCSSDLLAAEDPEIKQALLHKWHAWLQKRGHENADKAQLPARADLTKTALGKEFSLFCMNLVRENNLWYEKAIRDSGYEGLFTQNNYFNFFFAAAAWETLPVIDNHRYYMHPSNWRNAGSRVGKDSSVARQGDYWRSLNAGRLAGRPFLVGEYNHCFWNPYRHEHGLLFGAYSALQGFSAIVIHQDAVMKSATNNPLHNFSCGNSPVIRAGQFLSACLFTRGDVRNAEKKIHLNITKSYLEESGNAGKTVSTEQSKMALISDFSLVFPDLKTPAGIGNGGVADLTLYPSDAMEAGGSDWFIEVTDGDDKNFDLDKVVAKMKEKKLLSPDNLSVPSKGIFQSDTGEITLYAEQKLLKVITSQSEAVSLQPGKTEKLLQLTVNNSTVPACVAVCSIDGKALKNSGRMVLIYSTEEANSGMILAPDRERLQYLGIEPVLLRTGVLEAKLENNNSSSMELYALGMDGTRHEKLPLTREGKVLHIKLDTAQLKNGPTVFFELTVKE